MATNGNNKEQYHLVCSIEEQLQSKAKGRVRLDAQESGSSRQGGSRSSGRVKVCLHGLAAAAADPAGGSTCSNLEPPHDSSRVGVNLDEDDGQRREVANLTAEA